MTSRVQCEQFWPEFLPLLVGAQLALEGTEATLQGKLEDRLGKSPQERSRTKIDALIQHCSLRGKLAPSTKDRDIPDSEKSSLRWIPDTNSLKSDFAAVSGRYDDVGVRRGDVMQYIAFIHAISEVKL